MQPHKKIKFIDYKTVTIWHDSCSLYSLPTDGGNMNHFIVIIESIMEEKFRKSLQQEISLLRELLGNLSGEKSCLANQDKMKWNHTLQDRFTIMQKIKQVRTDRGSIEDSLQNPSCEITMLVDQLLTLLQKTYEELLYNDKLQLQHIIAIPQKILYPEAIVFSSIKKNALMTLP